MELLLMEDGRRACMLWSSGHRVQMNSLVELIFARRVVAMGEVDLLVQGGTDSTSFPALQIPQRWDREYSGSAGI
jgi:hypothetical protein